MGRKSSQDILENITSILREDGGNSIKEIIEKSGAQRNTVKKYLDSLEKQGLVEFEKEGREKVYYISPEYLNLSERSSRNFFGLKIEKEIEEEIAALCNSIIEKWEEKTGNKPNKTELQKTLARINDSLDSLDLPIGWYMYGEVCTVSFDPQQPFNTQTKVPETTEKMDKIEEAVDYNIRFDSVTELMEDRYKEKGKELYIVKHELKEDILPNNLPQSDVMPKIYKFAYNLPEIEDREAKNLIDEFISIFSQLYQKDDKFMMSELNSLFDAVWRLVALFNYRNDLRKHYPEKELEIKFKIEIESQKREVRERIENLQDFIPEPEIENEELSKLKGISKEEN